MRSAQSEGGGGGSKYIINQDRRYGGITDMAVAPCAGAPLHKPSPHPGFQPAFASAAHSGMHLSTTRTSPSTPFGWPRCHLAALTPAPPTLMATTPTLPFSLCPRLGALPPSSCASSHQARRLPRPTALMALTMIAMASQILPTPLVGEVVSFTRARVGPSL